jgi:hypothetical protein
VAVLPLATIEVARLRSARTLQHEESVLLVPNRKAKHHTRRIGAVRVIAATLS